MASKTEYTHLAEGEWLKEFTVNRTNSNRMTMTFVCNYYPEYNFHFFHTNKSELLASLNLLRYEVQKAITELCREEEQI